MESVSSAHHKLVLIADDHEIFRRGLRELINSIAGFLVVAEVGTCKDALTLIEQMNIELVMLATHFPDGDGIQFTRQLQQRAGKPPYVIMLSDMMWDETLVGAFLAGAEGYLTKDMPADDIIKSLQGFQTGQLALTRAMATNLVHLLVQRCAEKDEDHFLYLQNAITSIDMPSVQTEQIKDVSHTLNASSPILTQKEAKVFELLRNGHSNKQIASQLAISPYTVGKHVQKILRKLGVTNRTQAASDASYEGVYTFC